MAQRQRVRSAAYRARRTARKAAKVQAPAPVLSGAAFDGAPSPVDVARSQGYIAFTTGRQCPYDHFSERELVDAFYLGMSRAETDHAERERT